MRHTTATALLLTLMLPALLNAGPVDLLCAKRQAEAIVGKPMKEIPSATSRAADTGVPRYHIFAATEGAGFCIIAADDTLPPVLGYSTVNTVSPDATMPEALQLYLRNIDALEHADDDAPQCRIASLVGPLCPTEWGQDAPYNSFCPLKDGVICPTGCVATALAQIMYRWQWPTQGQGYSWAKDGNGETYSGTMEHTYNWESMCATTSENLASEAASQAVATLLYDCGLSVNMNYNTDGSGAMSPIKALYTNFGYIPTTLRLRFRNCYTTEEWMTIIKEELTRGRPIYYSAASETNGGKDAGGHAFVVDGYDTADNLHINWGWDGHWNGYYPLARLNPASYKFSLYQKMTTGIEPARHGETGEPTEYPYVSEEVRCNLSGYFQKTQAFNIIVGTISNLNANDHSWQFTVGIFDTKGKMLGEVKSGLFPALSLPSGYTTTTAQTILCKLKSTYTDGLYALRLLFREANTETPQEWKMPDVTGGMAKSAVYIKIVGNRVYITDGKDYIAASITTATPADHGHTTQGIGCFDILGRRLAAPQKGIIITRGSDGTVRKRVVDQKF